MNAHAKPAVLTVQPHGLAPGRNPAGGEQQCARPAARSQKKPAAQKVCNYVTVGFSDADYDMLYAASGGQTLASFVRSIVLMHIKENILRTEFLQRVEAGRIA
jgi:hypothetical protein